MLSLFDESEMPEIVNILSLLISSRNFLPQQEELTCGSRCDRASGG